MIWGRRVAEDTLANMTAALAARGSDAQLAATRQLALIVRRQAEVLALADVFLVLTVLFLGCVGLAALMRRPAAAAGGRGAEAPRPGRTTAKSARRTRTVLDARDYQSVMKRQSCVRRSPLRRGALRPYYARWARVWETGERRTLDLKRFLLMSDYDRYANRVTARGSHGPASPSIRACAPI